MNIKHQLYDINGYKILILNTNNDNISIKSLIDTGYIHEEMDNLGINHLLEHVLLMVILIVMIHIIKIMIV